LKPIIQQHHQIAGGRIRHAALSWNPNGREDCIQDAPTSPGSSHHANGWLAHGSPVSNKSMPAIEIHPSHAEVPAVVNDLRHRLLAANTPVFGDTRAATSAGDTAAAVGVSIHGVVPRLP
jgi:hypothetical protein